MAGKIFKDYLLAPAFLWRQLPDFYTIRSFFPYFFGRRRDFGNDALLLAVVEAFGRRGIRLVPGTDLAPNLLVRKKLYTRRAPTESQWEDIRSAWPILRELGRLDISQTITAAGRKILAVEGVDGTDETLKRAAIYARGADFIFLKTGKPNQDMRFDVPAIGFETLKTMVRTGAGVLALEAEKSFFIESVAAIVEFADRHHLSIVAVTEDDIRRDAFPRTEEEPANEPVGADRLAGVNSIDGTNRTEWTVLTRRRPSERIRRDIQFGRAVAERLARFGATRSVHVKDRAVLAVETHEGLADAIRRGGTICRGGFSVILTAPVSGGLLGDEPVDTRILQAMVDSGAKALALHADYPIADTETVLRFADRQKIAVVRMK